MTRRARIGFFTIDLSNEYGEQLLRGAAARCREHGLDLLVVDGGTLASRYEWEAQRNHLYSLVGRELFDGLLVAAVFGQEHAAEGARVLSRFTGIPIVTLTDKLPGAPAVRIDNPVGFRELVTHLLERCGAERFAVIAGPQDHFDSGERLAVLRALLEQRRVPLPPEAVFFGDFSDPSAREGVRALLDERRVRFDTLVCFNDVMAAAAVDELARRGLAVPADVRVTGFDNTYDSLLVDPPLTTVDLPAAALAAAGVDVLRGRMRGEQVPDLTVLPTTFLPRRSAGEVPASPAMVGPGRTELLGLAQGQLRLQRMEKRLFQLGEEIVSGLELAPMGPALARAAADLGLEDCHVALFTDPARTRARLLLSLEEGRLVSPPHPAEFPAAQLLPAELLARRSAWVLNALHVRDEIFGYFLVDGSDHPGIFHESLRHQLSTAVKGAQLMGAVQGHSAGLERAVAERTRALDQANRDLRAEIGRREVAERELQKRRHLDALGLLAGGIAHDFNNILTAVVGGLTLLQEDDDDPAARRDSYDLMMKAIGRARGLTQQLLTFAKGGSPVKRPLELVPLVEEIAQFLLHGSPVKAAFDLPGERLVVEMDQDQISQVLHNVVLNAVQAMPGGGTLSVRVRRQAAAAPEEPGRAVITIADTGPGIAPEIVDRIFDPYFTTKPGGTGLGLSTSQAIVQRHGGELRVASTPGRGTAFEIHLPLSARGVEPAPAPRAGPVPAGLSVLLLEDDESVIRVFARFLEALEARHRITRDGAEAVRLYREARTGGAPYDLVITDLTIPGGFGGAEVIRELRQLDPAVRAVVTSGYFDAPVLAEHARYGFRAVLRKPFSFEDFKRALGAALGAGR